MGGSDGVVHPDCDETVWEEEEEGIDEGLVFAYEEAEGEVVVVVSVVRSGPPGYGGWIIKRETAYLR